MEDYDIYLRHASVHDGEWTGFLLAWRDLSGVAGLPQRPHLRWRPWLLDPSNPNDPTLGDWGIWQWRFTIALFPVASGLQWSPPADARTPAEMRADLLAYIDLPAIQLKDADSAVYTVKMTAYSDQCIEPYTPTRPSGGWLATVEFAETNP
jgi:hypothetical protein